MRLPFHESVLPPEARRVSDRASLLTPQDRDVHVNEFLYDFLDFKNFEGKKFTVQACESVEVSLGERSQAHGWAARILGEHG